MDASAVIELLGLAPHPEGGFFRQTFADDNSTAIYYLIEGTAEWSKWHRVLDRTEMWHAYAGAALELEMNTGAQGSGDGTVRVGNDLAAGDRPQAMVPAGTWQRARSTGPWSLVGCTVSPPFTFDAFELRGDESSG